VRTIKLCTKEFRKRINPLLSQGTDYIFTELTGWALIPVIKEALLLR